MDSVVRSGDVDIAVREFGGSGRPLLLLHGAGNTLADMAPLAAHLTADHRVVGMDLRNHGRSADSQWTWDAVLGDISAVIEQLHMTSPILVGHSLGGMLAAMYADRIGGTAGAVNLDGFGTGRPEQYDMARADVVSLLEELRSLGDATIASLATPRTTDDVRAARQAWTGAAIALGLDPALAEDAFDRPLVARPDGTFARRPATQRLAELRECIDDLDVLALYAGTTAQQLVFIAGRDQPDPSLPSQLQALSAARRRGVTSELGLIVQARPNVCVIELDATHALIYEQPELIAARIREFAVELTAPAPMGTSR